MTGSREFTCVMFTTMIRMFAMFYLYFRTSINDVLSLPFAALSVLGTALFFIFLIARKNSYLTFSNIILLLKFIIALMLDCYIIFIALKHDMFFLLLFFVSDFIFCFIAPCFIWPCALFTFQPNVEDINLLSNASEVIINLNNKIEEQVDDESIKSEESSETNDVVVCAICLHRLRIPKEEETAGILLNCGHCYHKVCIEKWNKNNNTCPQCRQPIA
jgi:hypothetical protein